MGTPNFHFYTVDLGYLRADKQKFTTLEVMGLKTERTQINIAALEFGGVLANTICLNTTEAMSRQYSLHASILLSQQLY